MLDNTTPENDPLEEFRTKKFHLEQLLKSEGWKTLRDYYLQVKLARRNQLFGLDSNSMDDLIGLGQVKSELAGMDFVMGIPSYIIDEMDLEIQGLLQEEEENETT